MTTFGLDDVRSESLEATSKGNQRKWQDNGRFIKADTYIEESKNEVLAYAIGQALGLNVTPYYFCTLSLAGQEVSGCYSQTFLAENDVYISAAHILENTLQTFSKNVPAQTLFDDVSAICSHYTKLPLADLRTYWHQMLLFDFIICNEDRHTNNFGFVFSTADKSYRLAPLFDHGLSFLTNKEKYSTNLDVALRKFKAKPFSSDPIKNMILEKPCLDVTAALTALENTDPWRRNVVCHQVNQLTQKQ